MMQPASPQTDDLTGASAESEAGITVQAYTPRFVAAVNILLGIEGGHADDPLDRGGETNFGISLRFLAAEGAFDEDGDGKADFDLDFDGDIDGADIRALSVGDAKFLYNRCFWQSLGADALPKPLGEMLFDQAVNGGLHAAKKLLQRAINQSMWAIAKTAGSPVLLKIDGTLGDQTRKQLLRVLQYPALGMPALISAYRDAARDHYRAIVRRWPSQQRFLRGWLARAERLGAERSAR